MEEKGLHPFRDVRLVLARVHKADPIERFIEARERRAAVRDVEQRRLDASEHRGLDNRRVLP